MKFFIPFADDKDQEQRVHDLIVEHVSIALGAVIGKRRAFSLHYHHDGKNYYAEVGQNHSLNGEPVIVILHDDSRNLYLICTPSRGVVGGSPIMVGQDLVEESTFFES